MKIAEALLERAALQTKIATLESRITKNLLVQDGESPQEEPNNLIKDMVRASRELTELIVKIQQANASARLLESDEKESSTSLQEALVRRDGLVNLSDLLRKIAGEAVPNVRYSQTEIKMVPLVPSAELQKQADALAKEARELDVLIQKTNWSVNID